MRKRSQEEVVKEVNELTNGFYGTEKLIYTGADNKFTLVCPKLGEFKICLSKLR